MPDTVNRQILRLAVPAMVATITVPLMGLMDVAFTGHMGGPQYLAAIALGGNIINLLFYLFCFLRAGTSGMTAVAYGAGNRPQQALTLARSLVVAWSAGLLIIAMQSPLVALFGWFMAPPDQATWALAVTYFRILAWGAPALLSTFVLSGWFIGMQSSRTAMWMSLSVNVINFMMTCLLVVGFGLKVKGVAYGTLAAQWTGLLIGVMLVRKNFSGFGSMLGSIGVAELLRVDALKQFFSINAVLFFRTLCLLAVTLWFTRVGASQGDVVLAANSLLMQLFLFFSYVIDGFAYAAEALVGKCVGRGDEPGLRATVRGVLLWSGASAMLFMILYSLLGDWIFSLLSNVEAVRQTASELIVWAVAIPLAGFAAFTFDGIFVGAVRARPLLGSMAAGAAVYFAIYVILFPVLGNNGLWLAFVSYLATRSLVLACVRLRV